MERRQVLEHLDRARRALSLPGLRRAAEAAGRRIGLTKTGRIAVVAAVLPWLGAYLVAGTALYIFSYATVLVVGAAFLLAPRRLRITASREGLFPRVQAGDRLEVTVRFGAAGRVPPFLLEERLPTQLSASVRVPIPRIGAGHEVSHTYSLRCTQRGVYEIGPLVAVAGDPFGLTQRETVLCEPFQLTVHPRIERVADRPLTREYEDPPIRPPVSRPWPSGMELYGMREMRPGDDIRRIVWRATARTGELIVWEAEQGITDRITILLDTDRGHHSRDGEISQSFETGVRIAASLGVRHLVEGYEVRCEANAGPLVLPLRGMDKQLGLLDALARADLAREPLLTSLRRITADVRRDAHIVLITPRLGPADAAQLKLVLDTGASVLVVALLWDEDDSDTMARAASLGCSVAGVRPGEDLAGALASAAGGAVL